jgi:hypothetical protein
LVENDSLTVRLRGLHSEVASTLASVVEGVLSKVEDTEVLAAAALTEAFKVK